MVTTIDGLKTAQVLEGLKDFQRRTARWVFHRMFDPEEPSFRFLVADEVGLGKTHVAKGVVAQVIEHLRRTGDERQDIVYICSNAAIARQNLRKLVPAGITPIETVDRLTMLPVADLDRSIRDGSGVNLLAITPGTSLKFGHRTGTMRERSLAYEFLRAAWGPSVMIPRARRLFWNGISAGEPDQRLRAEGAAFRGAVRRNLDDFQRVLGDVDADRQRRGDASLWDVFCELVDGLAWQRGIPTDLGHRHAEFIRDVRQVMAIVGVASLKPDLVIMDEFQRFKDLLQPESSDFGSLLAHRLFNHVDETTGQRTRTLMLSATPYRMYTNGDESDGDHYEDFLATCRFLFDDDDRVDTVREQLADLRHSLVSADRLHQAPALCAALGDSLRTVMVRTERLAATPDRDGMLVERECSATIEPDDLRAYLRIANLAEAVGHYEPTEYWKSAPYLVNFMETYELKIGIQRELGKGNAVVSNLFSPGPGLLNWAEVDAYRSIDPENGRLRWLIRDLSEHRAFELLWVPPSWRYYDTGSVYETPEASTFTKRLVFSGWAVVPKAVSSLVTLEAERVAYQSRTHRYTADYRQRGAQRLNFRTGERRSSELRAGELNDRRRASAMTAFGLTWPGVSLASLGDPRCTTAVRPHRDEMLHRVANEISKQLQPLLRVHTPSAAIDQRWYWAAPLLLDQQQHPFVIDLLLSNQAAEIWEGRAAGDGLRRHIAEAAALVDAGAEALGTPPTDLAAVLAEVAVAAPTVCALRALASVTGLPLNNEVVIRNAARIGASFRAFFNAPEVTGIVARGSSEDPERDDDTTGRYWRDVVRHCLDGNLQALLDEHVHVLRDWRGFTNLADEAERGRAADDLSAALTESLQIRTSSFRVDIPTASDDSDRYDLEEHRMRTRFAVAFGNQRIEGGGEARVESISTAFNSPFWPFVLVSTSVGQEGLDFHLWCHAVVHWNLPSNPVDLEQREGRVHRYKGHAVRRNIASAIGLQLHEAPDSGDVWQGFFEAAVAARNEGDSELVPYWVFPHGTSKIERYAPMLPFSRDAAALPRLRRRLAAYRLAFGQPRQEELIEFLGADRTDEQLLALAAELRIDLSPPAEPSSP